MPDVNAIVEGLRTEFKNLAILVERLMTKQEETEKKLDKISEKVDELNEKPAKKWDTVSMAVLTAIIGVVIGILINGKIT